MPVPALLAPFRNSVPALRMIPPVKVFVPESRTVPADPLAGLAIVIPALPLMLPEMLMLPRDEVVNC